MIYSLRHFIGSVVLATASLCGLTTHAAPIQEKTIDKLMQLSDIKGILKESNQELKPMYDQQAETILKEALAIDSLNEKEQKAALKISELIASITSNVTEDQQFYDLIKNAYRKAYTEEEAQAYIAFLSTPIGQSITKKSTLLMGDLMKQSMELTQNLLADPKKKEEFMAKFSAIMEPLIQSRN